MRIITINILRYLSIFIICLPVYNTQVKAQEKSALSDFQLNISSSIGIQNNLVIYLTGDGGWNSFNQGLIQEFEKQGYGVVALKIYEVPGDHQYNDNLKMILKMIGM